MRSLLDRPLISYAIETAIKSECFDRVFVNTESDEIGGIAREWGAEFYRRGEHLAGDNVKNEDFVHDFIESNECDYLFMLNPTSPLLTVDEVRRFTELMLEGAYDSMFSVRRVAAQTFYDGRPLNFNPDAPHVSSQDLPPVEYICWAITGWNAGAFMKAYSERGFAAYCGRIGTFALSEFSSIDIDHEEDFQLAESIMRHKKEGANAVGA